MREILPDVSQLGSRGARVVPATCEANGSRRPEREALAAFAYHSRCFAVVFAGLCGEVFGGVTGLATDLQWKGYRRRWEFFGKVSCDEVCALGGICDGGGVGDGGGLWGGGI